MFHRTSIEPRNKRQSSKSRSDGALVGLLRHELAEMGELFGGAGYTAVSQMIGRTRRKDQKGLLRFKLDELTNKCVK
jgi:hypothetical protein